MDELKVKDKGDRAQSQPSAQISDQYCTSLYKQLGMPTCGICGEKKRTVEGQQICPLSQPNCSFVKQGAIQ
ncbi:MAG TPA: hypothetical protein DCY88_07830 [Cyanobacteria bacterium UBA11372]|nr:hypothetical protein [Cyanobacteria bacterium UBA11372]